MRLANRLRRLVGKPIVITDADLRYAATSRCPCGAGLAYVLDADFREPNNQAWDCAEILKGTAIHKGQPGAKEHTGRLPFAFYEVKSEIQPSACGRTTRPVKEPA